MAATTKYTGAAFIPLVLAMCFLSNGATTVVQWVRPAARSVVAALVAVGMLVGGYHLWGASIRQGLSFTTTGRKALDPQPMVVLVRSVVDDIGLLLVLTMVALVLLAVRRSWRNLLIGLVCLGGGLLLPLSQLHIHEFTSLDKHTAFSALFLALPAGLALAAAFTRRGIAVAVAAVVLWLAVIDGLWRSDIQYSWPTSLMKTLSAVEATPVPGEYLSTNGDILRYYSPQGSPVIWEANSVAYSVLGQSVPAVREVVRSHQFAGFVYQSGDVSPQDRRRQAALTAILSHDPYYRRVAISGESLGHLGLVRVAEADRGICRPGGVDRGQGAAPRTGSGEPGKSTRTVTSHT